MLIRTRFLFKFCRFISYWGQFVCFMITCKIVFLCVFFMFVWSSVVSASDCLERLVHKMPCYVSSGTYKIPLTESHSKRHT